jgi:outer membrane receptor for ferrienterochelin and colicin
MKSLYITLTLLLGSALSFAQTGTLSGKISDAKSNEALIGAIIRVETTALGASTDVEGNFTIARVPAGVYKVTISSVGYVNKVYENVRIEAGKTTVIDTKIAEDSKTLGEVVVKAQRLTSTDVAIITEIKQIQQVAVGVSAQQIQKTQDRDAAQVVRRIPGITINDDRFIVVRGLNERYNTVMLNDLITPSTEVDSKSFSFDLIPSSAIDRVLVYKSASADLPGDISGGAIKIYTKTVPDGNSFSVGFSTGIRANTTFTSRTTHVGSSTDWLGFDNGLRTLPSNFASRNSVINYASNPAVIDKFKALPAYYNVESINVLPDFRFNTNFSRRFFIKDIEVTNISYLNYSNTNQFAEIAQNRYFFDGSDKEQYNDQTLGQNVRVGAMSNWAFILNPKTKIEFRNLFNQIGIKETILRRGINDQDLELNNGAFRYEQRSIYTGQLSGTHELAEGSKLRWIGGFGYTLRKEPDYRRFTSSRKIGTNDPFVIDIQQFESPTLQQAARSYSYLDEYAYTGSLTFDKMFGSATDEETKRAKLSVGSYVQYKDRFFQNRWFGVVNPNRLPAESPILSNGPSKFFGPENLASNLVYYAEGTNQEDRYTAQNLYLAGFASYYWPISQKLNATIGIRGEYNRQQLQSQKRGSGEAIDVDNPVFSPLPSVNLTYNFSEKHLLRAGYSITVNRPEFRELAPFTYYDFTEDVTRRGYVKATPNAPGLLDAQIMNFDLRYEFYPTKTEIVSVALFNKQFSNPIEAAIFYNGSSLAFTVNNADKAFARGVELEIRKSLSPLGGKFFDRSMLVFNGALIDSDVRAGLGNVSLDRNLQGQSPYMLNFGYFYNDEKAGWQANVLYNVIGPRIYAVGDNEISASIFEMPRHVVDLNLTKTLSKKAELRINIQDLFNQPFLFRQDTNRDNEITDADRTFKTFKRGTYSSIGVVYKF